MPQGTKFGGVKTENNLKATAKAVANLHKKDPLAALRHPCATRDQLAEWMMRMWSRPSEGEMLEAVKSNPALQMMFLETPADNDPLLRAIWWRQMRHEEDLAKKVVRELDSDNQIRLAISIAESVLPVFEAREPGVKTPREAIEIMKRYLEGSALEDDCTLKSNAARETALHDVDVDDFVAWAAARVASFCASIPKFQHNISDVMHTAARCDGLQVQPDLSISGRENDTWPSLKAYAERYLSIAKEAIKLRDTVGAADDEIDFGPPLPIPLEKKIPKSLKKVDSARDELRSLDDHEVIRRMEPLLMQMDILAKELAEDYSQLQPAYADAYEAWKPTPEVRAQWARWSPVLDEYGADAMMRREEAGGIAMRKMHDKLEITPKLIRFFGLLVQLLSLAHKRRYMAVYARAISGLIEYLNPDDIYPYGSMGYYPAIYAKTIPASMSLAQRFVQLSREISGLARQEFTLDKLRTCLDSSREIPVYFRTGNGKYLGAVLREIIGEMGRSKQIPTLGDLLIKNQAKTR